jgi:hypothetical protein
MDMTAERGSDEREAAAAEVVTTYSTTLTRDDLRALMAALLPELLAQVVRDNGGKVPGAKE